MFYFGMSFKIKAAKKWESIFSNYNFCFKLKNIYLKTFLKKLSLSYLLDTKILKLKLNQHFTSKASSKAMIRENLSSCIQQRPIGSRTGKTLVGAAAAAGSSSNRQSPTSPLVSSSESGSFSPVQGSTPRLLIARRQQRDRLELQSPAAHSATSRCMFGGSHVRSQLKLQCQGQRQARQPQPEISANNLCAESSAVDANQARHSTGSSADDAESLKNEHQADAVMDAPSRSRSDDDDEDSDETRKARLNSLTLKKQFIYYQGKMKTVLVQDWPDARRIPVHERHRLQDPMKKHYGRLSQRARLLKEFESKQRSAPRETIEMPLLPRRMQQEARVRLMAWYRPIKLELNVSPGSPMPATFHEGATATNAAKNQ